MFSLTEFFRQTYRSMFPALRMSEDGTGLFYGNERVGERIADILTFPTYSCFHETVVLPNGESETVLMRTSFTSEGEEALHNAGLPEGLKEAVRDIVCGGQTATNTGILKDFALYRSPGGAYALQQERNIGGQSACRSPCISWQFFDSNGRKLNNQDLFIVYALPAREERTPSAG